MKLLLTSTMPPLPDSFFVRQCEGHGVGWHVAGDAAANHNPVIHLQTFHHSQLISNEGNHIVGCFTFSNSVSSPEAAPGLDVERVTDCVAVSTKRSKSLRKIRSSSRRANLVKWVISIAIVLRIVSSTISLVG